MSIVGGHSCFVTVPQYFNCMFCILVKFGIRSSTCSNLCQDTISIQKVSIYVKKMLSKFHENQGPVTYLLNLLQTQGPNSSKGKVYNKYVSV